MVIGLVLCFYYGDHHRKRRVVTDMSVINVSEEAYSTEDIEVFTKDGFRLVGKIISPLSAPEAITVIHAATGVPATYYEAYAKWLCVNRSVRVLVYDYRDFGKSAVSHLKNSEASMADWGVHDQSAVLTYAVENYPDLPVWVVGHSLGGLCVSFHEHADKVEKLITVASGPAYWKHHPLHFIPLALAFWWVIGPLSTALMGYLPGRMIGFGADVPAPVYWQWRRWCITRTFYENDWGKTMPLPDLEKFKGDLHIIGIEGDTSIPPYVAKSLARYYPAANMSFRVFKPDNYGLKTIGHIGAFARRNNVLWPNIIPA